LPAISLVAQKIAGKARSHIQWFCAFFQVLSSEGRKP
jgi:hypothetical protein